MHLLNRERPYRSATPQFLPLAEREDYSESAQRESNPHFRHGKATGCRYIMGAMFVALRSAKERPFAERKATIVNWDRKDSNLHLPG